jgi:hypothetical protein
MTSVCVLVHIGDELPTYMNDCIDQLNKACPTLPIHVLVNRKHIDSLAGSVTRIALEDIPTTTVHNDFLRRSSHNTSFRGGFWRYTTERFLYLYDYSVMAKLSDIFHIENDNLVFHDFTDNLELFRSNESWMVLDHPSRCIPSFMYFRDQTILRAVVDKIAELAVTGKNDMESMAIFATTHSRRVGMLPIITGCAPSAYSQHASTFGYLFDGAAVGQFIGGVDPRNKPGDTCGFINETTVFRCDQQRVEWRGPAGRRCPFMNDLPLVNLHIHSKDLARWKWTG